MAWYAERVAAEPQGGVYASVKYWKDGPYFSRTFARESLDANLQKAIRVWIGVFQDCEPEIRALIRFRAGENDVTARGARYRVFEVQD